MMRKHGLKWFIAMLAIAMVPSTVVFADPPVATPKTSPPWPNNVPPVPRGIPDLVPYWKFDPPKSSLFDINKLTVSGDLRVRPEFRTNGTFGYLPGGGAAASTFNGGNTAPTNGGTRLKRNDSFVQQWMRLGLNYSISPDVDVFFQPQYAKNWGAAPTGGISAGGANCGAAICANDPFNLAGGNSFFVRQAFVILRNAGAKGLDFKLGRQLIVMGNHRLFGHFDWANTGFSHDGISMQYKQPKWTLYAGWFKPQEGDFNAAPAGTQGSFGLAVPGADGPNGSGGTNPACGATGTPQFPTNTGNCNTDSTDDADLFVAQFVAKPMKGLSIEPLWALFINGTPSTGRIGGTIQAHAPNQNRHTLGGRAAFKQQMFDVTTEAYWQTGSIGVNGGNSSRDLRINAWAFAADAGVTLPVAMKPRLGFEFNGASGDGDANCNTSGTGGAIGSGVVACNGNANTFENLYPTNHILMGYMDLMSWRNMIDYAFTLKMKPQAASHFEAAFRVMRRQTSGDNWYRAAQNVYFANVVNANGQQVTTSSSFGQELDVIYTHFVMAGKVALQAGYGHFFPGEFVEQSVGNDSPAGQDWGYAQIHVNF